MPKAPPALISEQEKSLKTGFELWKRTFRSWDKAFDPLFEQQNYVNPTKEALRVLQSRVCEMEFGSRLYQCRMCSRKH
jgi:hypothetical protein